MRPRHQGNAEIIEENNLGALEIAREDGLVEVRGSSAQTPPDQNQEKKATLNLCCFLHIPSFLSCLHTNSNLSKFYKHPLAVMFDDLVTILSEYS